MKKAYGLLLPLVFSLQLLRLLILPAGPHVTQSMLRTFREKVKAVQRECANNPRSVACPGSYHADMLS